MADLTSKDWGRIYAYMWLQDRVGNPYYKNLLEQDPVRAVTEIVQALNKEYPDPNLKIEYKSYVDAVWDIQPPTDLWPEDKRRKKLEAYRKGGDGDKRATLRMRFAC